MKTVKVRKEEALAILKRNRAEHREIFEEAVEGYRKAVTAHLEHMLADIKAGKRIEHQIRLAQPTDQTKEYDRAIKMLEMSVDDEIELDERSFANFIMDDWSWMDQFLLSNTRYSPKAAQLSKSRPSEEW
jgi:hypothetical protein